MYLHLFYCFRAIQNELVVSLHLFYATAQFTAEKERLMWVEKHNYPQKVQSQQSSLKEKDVRDVSDVSECLKTYYSSCKVETVKEISSSDETLD